MSVCLKYSFIIVNNAIYNYKLFINVIDDDIN